ncbi:transcription initiation factor TFIID subunit 4-like [Panicum virgatum]|uniref:Uncharacterized protein n=1 Tax=Panicum virgatum TaxID=38727 RepID=A0A8T0X142_PANVG|nr:transcription initiation factor TFIID subunit 4-like [Panicum virgatum]KAG2653145.1 hypothetical protein PVAP13_1NG432038 [Panicum virgatum]
MVSKFHSQSLRNRSLLLFTLRFVGPTSSIAAPPPALPGFSRAATHRRRRQLRRGRRTGGGLGPGPRVAGSAAGGGGSATRSPHRPPPDLPAGRLPLLPDLRVVRLGPPAGPPLLRRRRPLPVADPFPQPHAAVVDAGPFPLTAAESDFFLALRERDAEVEELEADLGGFSRCRRITMAMVSLAALAGIGCAAEVAAAAVAAESGPRHACSPIRPPSPCQLLRAIPQAAVGPQLLRIAVHAAVRAVLFTPPRLPPSGPSPAPAPPQRCRVPGQPGAPAPPRRDGRAATHMPQPRAADCSPLSSIVSPTKNGAW